MTDNHLKTASVKLRGLVKELPRLHLMLAAIAAAIVFLALLLPSEEVQANRRAMALPVELEDPPQLTLPEFTQSELLNPDATAADQTAEREPWQELTVRKGDNLAKLFERAGLSPAELHELLQSGPEAKTLTRIFPGQKLSFQVDDNGQLTALRYQENMLNSTEYHRDDNNFVAEKTSRDPEVRHQFASGTIVSSLYKAGMDAGLNDGTILQMANIFNGVVDFVLDLRANDHFSVMYDEYYLDGKKIDNGPILAATFTNQGKTYTAYRYTYADGSVDYFSPEGVSMRRTFMRAPLDFTRISSPFSMNRIHPLFKTGRPHRGIDYAAPAGTPVYAAGDGRIAQSGYSPSNGNFVVIEHGQTYTTKYLHLQKRAVKAGERVKQHQVVGWVGSTGWATGPHLHYEFLVNGVHYNPATIVSKLPKAKHIENSDKQRFIAQISGLQLQFAAYVSHTKLASAATTDDERKSL
jgi:murein DD-endopeptidase MepM/ murein hydrolase activator NlpD